jgi:lysophospholipase L1-like esterase
LLAQPPVMGAEFMAVSRNLLAHDRLDLSAWHGSQEVLLNRICQPDRVEVDFALADGASLSLLTCKTAHSINGLRLSLDPAHPSIAFVADGDGRFLERYPLPLRIAPGWHRIDLRTGVLSLDGAAPIDPHLQLTNGVFGLRGNQKPALVRRVRLWQGGQLLVAQGFANQRNFGITFVTLCALMLALVSVPMLMLRGKQQFWVVLTELLLAGAVFGTYAFDWIFWSARYHYVEHIRASRVFRGEIEPFEMSRIALSHLFDPLDPVEAASSKAVVDFLELKPGREAYALQLYPGGRLDDSLPAIKAHPKGHPTVLFLGTSQTWGEGASRPEKRMVTRFYDLLERPGLLVVNGARQGSNSSELLQRYRDRLLAFQPELTIVVIGTNDNDPVLLQHNLEAIVALHPETLLVIEPNDPEQIEVTPANRAAIVAVAREHHIPMVDLQAEFNRVDDCGFLWWDFVHPTSLGHDLLAQFLLKALPLSFASSLQVAASPATLTLPR